MSRHTVARSSFAIVATFVGSFLSTMSFESHNPLVQSVSVKNTGIVALEACDEPQTAEENAYTYITTPEYHENADLLLHGGRHGIA